ncbi:tetratricopeptide repeat protein [bacterium]|nr:tetratricopeptide repeat protein [bacterium]
MITKHLFINNQCLFIVLLSALVTPFIHAQDINQQLRLAREYESAGRWKEARQLYESMYSEQPNHPVLYERLKELYMRTFAYTNAKAIIERQLKHNPDNPHLEVDLARVIFRMGNEKGAFDKLDSILKKYPETVSVYQLVASVYTAERLYDLAIKTYLKGRETLNQPNQFAISLSQLYAAQSDYILASEELVSYLKKNPTRIQFVQTLYLKYPKSEQVLKQLTGPLKRALDGSPDQLVFYRLLAKLYEHHEQYADALKIIQTLEKESPDKNQGNALFQFAEEVFLKGSIIESKAAFQKILTSYPQFQKRDRVLFGLAQCHEAESDYQQAIITYKRIVSEFDTRDFSKYAALHMGLLQRDRLFNVEDAIHTFQSIKNKNPGIPISWTAELELAQCYMIKNDTVSALPLLLQNIHRRHPDRPGHDLQAMYHLGQLYYFNGDYKKSLVWLDSLASNKWRDSSFQHPFVNDGLKLRFYIHQYYKSYPVQLHYLSRTDHLIFQRDYETACTTLDTVMKNSLHAPIQGDALFKKGELMILLNKNKNALLYFQKLLDVFPHHLLADHALERCGYLYEKLNKNTLALKQYEKLLTDYPHSLFSDDIRKRIQNIEKKSL